MAFVFQVVVTAVYHHRELCIFVTINRLVKNQNFFSKNIAANYNCMNE